MGLSLDLHCVGPMVLIAVIVVICYVDVCVNNQVNVFL